MEKLPGRVFSDVRTSMSWDSKVELVKTLCTVLSRLFEQQLSGIGNLYPESKDIGPIVLMSFFWDKHLAQDVSQGPFSSSYDWLNAIIQFTINDTASILSHPTDPDNEDNEDNEDEHELAEETQALANRLLVLLPRIFPPSAGAPHETTILHHDDLSSQNLLVNSFGQLSGIVDWECVSSVPLWRACTLPSFLTGCSRDEQPDPEKYGKGEQGNPNELYFEHFQEWQTTRLRAVFIDEMDRVRPEWMSISRQSLLKNDFFTALIQCSSELCQKCVGKWIDQVEGGTDDELRGAPWVGYHTGGKPQVTTVRGASVAPPLAPQSHQTCTCHFCQLK
jgi:hypothetical protein